MAYNETPYYERKAMKNIREINSMSTEELETEQSRLYRKLAKRVFVYPALTVATVYVIGKVLDRKTNSATESA